MAHELEIRNGRASMIYNVEGGTPWHKLGNPARPDIGYDEALQDAGVLYEVAKRPLYSLLQVDDGNLGANRSSYVASDRAVATYRTDTGRELGVVSPGYSVVQNRDAFQVLLPLLDAGIAHIETAGVLRDGADAWLLVRFDLDRFGPIAREVFSVEGLKPYGMIRTNHSGRSSVLVANTDVRAVCANTVGLIELGGNGTKQAWVQHTGDATQRLVEACRALFDDMIAQREEMAVAYQRLRGFRLDQALFRELVLDVAAPDPRDNPRFNPEAKLADLVVTRAEVKRNEITKLWTEGLGHVGDHSAWEAYNGLVQVLDHNTALYPTRAGAYRTASLMEGNLRKIKDQVFANLESVALEA